MHEIAHALGIYHEQSRPDRDNYITIQFQNVRTGKEHNFRKQNADNIDSLGTPYDYLSMMHYSDSGFSKNRKPTIVTKDPKMQNVIGQRNGFSEIDKKQINLMYCGDKPVPTTKAPTTTPTERNGNCTFQNGLCTWLNQPTTKNEDNFDWTVKSGSTPSSSTGPRADRNGNKYGKYIYLEASSPRRSGDKTRLISKSFSQYSGDGHCFGFFYHMYGSSIGTLNIYVKSAGREQLVWTLSGSKGNKWLNGQVNVGVITGTYQVVIEGIRGKEYTGDIAIDDFTFRPDSCDTLPTTAIPKPSPSTTNTPKVNNGDCTFQNGFCTWFNQPTTHKEDKFDWVIRNGRTPSSNTGPNADRNGDIKGKYVYLEASHPRVPGDKTRLVSGSFFQTSTTGQCFRFFYHMYGSDIGELNIYVKSGATEKLVWTLSGNQGNKWFNGQVTVGTGSKTYKVIIEGIRGKSYTADIAVDDFTFIPGSCSTIPV